MKRIAAWISRFPLWSRLAVFAAVGVVATHTLQLAIGNRLAVAALAGEQEALGRSVARLVARQSADALLVDDSVALQEIVTSARASSPITYCFIERGGRVLAHAPDDIVPASLLAARRGVPDEETILIRRGDARYLDVAEPILAGHAGRVRLGMDLDALLSAQRRLELVLRAVALVVIAAGVIAAFLVGRWTVLPVAAVLAAADRFEPGKPIPELVPSGSSEFVQLAERFNQMMHRLRATHEAHERALQRSMESERLVALGALVAGVAHEVNNPLAGLKNCHARLERGDLSAEKRGEYLELMGDALDRIEAIMQRLLDFGRPRPLAIRPERPSELLLDVARLVEPGLRRRGVALVVPRSGGEDEPRVLADRRQVSQALLNLWLNAAYVTPDGGRIRASIRSRPGFAGLAIEDEGPGIPVALRGRVLDPFFTTKPAGEGTGLGLSVTRAIADAHQGELAFDFPERGAIAILWLPLA